MMISTAILLAMATVQVLTLLQLRTMQADSRARYASAVDDLERTGTHLEQLRRALPQSSPRSVTDPWPSP